MHNLLRLPIMRILLAFYILFIGFFFNVSQAWAESVDSPSIIRVGIPERQTTLSSEGDNISPLISFHNSFWHHWGKLQQEDVEFVYIDPKKMAQALSNNQIDIASSLSFTEPPQSKFTYSIPYIKYKQQLFRRIDSNLNNGIQIGIQSANFKALDFLPEQITREYFFTLTDLLAQVDKFDALFSAQPWLLAQEIKHSPLQNQFYTKDAESSFIYFHFITRKTDKALSLSVNKVIRNISKEQALAWQTEFFETNKSLFTLTLGNYLTNISSAEENYILNNNTLYYPIKPNGTLPYITPRHYENIGENGISVKYAHKITEKTGLIFKPYHLPINAQQEAYKNNIDVLLHAEYLPETSSPYFYSEPYLKTGFSIVTRQKQFLYKQASEFSDEEIAVIAPQNVLKQLEEKAPKAQFIPFSNVEKAIKALKVKDVNYVIANNVSVQYVLEAQNLPYVMSPPLNIPTHTKEISFATLAPNNELFSLLNQSITSITNDEIAQKLNANSNSASPPVVIEVSGQTQKQIQRQRYIILGMLLIGLSALWFFYRQYKYNAIHQQAVEKALSQAESAKLDAEKSAQAKITFLARMSHEIRTPMNGVLGMAEALAYTELDDNQKKLLETLNSSASNLLALLNDVLDFSKMDAGKLTLESLPVNLRSLFTSIFNSFKHIENEKSITILLDIDSNIHESYYIDPTRITQVLNNLMSNAIKFTPQGSVVLSLKLVEQDKKNEIIYDTITISVQDTGIGISPENQSSLFTPFIQADDDITRKFGGTGLGLSICHEIVTAMGSAIELDSEKDKGCNFYFNLKLKQAKPNDNKIERRKNLRDVNDANDNRFKHLRILIAEDNLVNIQVLCAQLKRLNIDADIAYDGAQALEMHNQKAYDIIISDCHMPQMDGFELANTISQNKKQIPIWLIAITADALQGAASKCIAAGFDDYMAKPCPQEQITNKLNHAYRQLIVKRENYLIEKLKEAPYVLFKPHDLFLIHDNDIVLSRNLAEIFINSWHTEKELFLAELAQHNFDQIYALAHKQKSVIRYLCGNNLEGIVVSLEKHAQNKNIAKTQKTCLLLIKELDILQTEINHWLKTLSQHHQFFRLS